MTDQTSLPRTFAQPGKSAGKSRVPALTAAILSIGFYVCEGLTYDPTHLINSFIYASTIGLVALAMVFAILYLALRILCWQLARLAHRDQWMRAILAMGFIFSVGVVPYEWKQTRPINIFRNEVVSPIPASLSDLRITKFTSFQEGFAWLFSFKVSPEDFNFIRDARHLKQIPVDLDQRQIQLTDMLKGVQSPNEIKRITDSIFREDSSVSSNSLYVRPPDPEFYKADRIQVVTDRSHSIVYVYIDHH